MTRKVLLIEFVIVDRFHCGASFPYIQGWLRDSGCETAIVQFGLNAASAMADELSHHVALSDGDILRLKKIISGFSPTHILFSHHPSKMILDETKDSAPNAHTAYLTSRHELISCRDGIVSFPSWLQLQGSNYNDFFCYKSPDFSAYSGNKSALAFRPLPHIRFGPECLYRKSVATNPFFKEIDLSSSIRQDGCTFCMRPDGNYQAKGFEGRFLKQLKQAKKTTRWKRHRARYRIIGDEIYNKLEWLSETIISARINASDFLFNCRVDHVVRLRKSLEQAIASFSGAQNRIQLCLIGVENFSQRELDRFNKGITTEMIITMVGILRELERKYPRGFDYREYGGFSTILYTPWTTLEDLQFNLSLVHHLGIEKVCGKLLSSRLRLYHGLPIARLAERDTLLMKEYDDPVLNTAKRNFYDAEIPWHFQDKRVEMFNKIALRMHEDDSLQGDAFYGHVQRWLKEMPNARESHAGTAKKLLERFYSIEDKEVLLSELLGSVHDNGEGKDVKDASLLVPEIAIALMRKGVKKVGRVENISRVAAQTVVAKLKESFPNGVFVEIVLELQTHISWDACDVFFGYCREDVMKLIQLTKIIQGNYAQIEKQKAIRDAGVLLGYPECCVDAYARASLFQRTYPVWMHLRNRIESQREALIEMNPYNKLLLHCPCSLHCAGTLAIIQLLLKELSLWKHGKMASVARKRLEKPVFSLLDRERQFVVFKPLRAMEEDVRFRYNVVDMTGTDRRLDFIAKGDSMEIKKGCISVYRKEKKLYDYVLNAYIWWYKRAFHPEFWRLCIENEGVDLEYTDTVQKNLHKEFYEEVQRFFEKTCSLVSNKTGCKINNVRFLEGAGIEVTMEHAQEKIQFRIEPVDTTHAPLIAGENYVIICDRQKIFETRKIQIMKLILKILDVFKNKEKMNLKSFKSEYGVSMVEL